MPQPGEQNVGPRTYALADPFTSAIDECSSFRDPNLLSGRCSALISSIFAPSHLPLSLFDVLALRAGSALRASGFSHAQRPPHHIAARG